MDSKPLQPVGLAWRPLRLCLFSVPLVAASCSRYPIAEAATARLAGELAIDAGATTYASSEYDRYLGSMDSAKQLLEQEQARRPWSRDYAPARQILTRAETEAEQALQTAVQMRDRYRGSSAMQRHLKANTMSQKSWRTGKRGISRP